MLVMLGGTPEKSELEVGWPWVSVQTGPMAAAGTDSVTSV